MPQPPNADPIESSVCPGPWGDWVLASQGTDLVGVWFQDQTQRPPWAAQAQPQPLGGVRAEAQRQLLAFAQGQQAGFALPLRWLGGTPFQRRVWEALRALPYGSTTHYGALAQALGMASAARAVGAAVGRNPLMLIVPCHRVLGRQGALTGYAGGLARKQRLLALEAQGLETQGQAHRPGWHGLAPPP
jgi:methylated-DNA-[protein]-cysteine S-methyltransferase